MPVDIKLDPNRRQCYRQDGYWGDATLLDYWNMSLLSAPEKEAVIDSYDNRYTYKQLDEAASRVASFLRETGVKPGGIVSLQLPGWAEFTIIYVACLKVGAVVNPILPNFRVAELGYILNKCESQVLFLPHEFRCHSYSYLAKDLLAQAPSLKKLVVVDKYGTNKKDFTLKHILEQYEPVSFTLEADARNADSLAAVLFTSGTEAKPKGVMLTHNNILACEKSFNATFNISFIDTMLMPAPVAHATGFLHGVISPLISGGTSVLEDIFKPEKTLMLIEQERCTVSMGATPFLFDLLEELEHSPKDISSLRFFLCGGAPIPQKTIEKATDSGVKVLAVYGATESAPHTATRPWDSDERSYCTDGRALPGIEIKIVDDERKDVAIGVQGEEASRGPNVFVGYLKEPELTSKVLDDDGWYYSGDLCTCDEHGYIRVTGRKKDIIIRGGENISCKEVENILLDVPNIKDAVVVGMPDKKFGEKICAYVVLEDAQDKLTLEIVTDHFESKKVAKFKFPERLEILDALPRTPSGKVQKYLLRDDVKKKLSAEKCT